MTTKVILLTLWWVLAFLCACETGQNSLSERPIIPSSPTNEVHIDGLVRIGNPPPTDSPTISFQCTNEQTCWINTPNILWRTLDGGKNWQEIYRALTDDNIEASNLVSEKGWLIVSDKLLMTQDGGLTWSEKQSPLRFPNGDGRSIWFLDDGQTGWLAGGRYRPQTEEELRSGVPPKVRDITGKKVLQEAIYTTTDGGNSWIEQSLPAMVGRIMQVQFLSKNQGVALGKKMVYYTKDGGQMWERGLFPTNCVSREYFSKDNESAPSKLFSLNSSELLLSYDDGRVLKSRDSGRSWCDLMQPAQVQFESGANQPQYFTDLFFEGEETGWGLGWDRFLYQSADGGKHWSRVTSQIRFNSMTVVHGNKALLVSESGVFLIPR